MQTAELFQRTGAAMNRGGSKQDYATPRVFLDAVENRFGTPHFDLAASAENAVTQGFYDEERDALKQDWAADLGRATAWLNPPFSNVAPWAERCARYSSPRLRILFLVQASVGSEWFAEHVFPHAFVLALRPRISFDGKNPFPKDLILAGYGFGVRGFDLWRWR